MRCENGGMISWWCTEDAPAPEGRLPAGTAPSVTVAIQPIDASNAVEVLYGTAGSPLDRRVTARWWWNDTVGGVQYFRAELPVPTSDTSVEYVVVSRCIDRQVPAPADLEAARLGFTVKYPKTQESETATSPAVRTVSPETENPDDAPPPTDTQAVPFRQGHPQEPAIQQFLDHNSKTSLAALDFLDPAAVATLDFGDLERDSLLPRLAACGRLLQLHPSWPVVEALAAAGFTSAHEIATWPEHRFVHQQGPPLDGLGDTAGHELAQRIHRRAADVVERVRLHTMNLLALQPGGRSAAMLPNNAPPALLAFYQGLPSYQELFGSLDYLHCDTCRSMWSPAAYFVDLMRLIDGNIERPTDKPLSLGDRRPDLWQIPLDCVASEQEIPYLEIVNGILAANIESRIPPTAGSKGDRAQPVDAGYQVATAIYPFSLPYNHPLEQIRALLCHFQLPLADIYAAFQVDAAAIANESLALSPGQVSVLTDDSDELHDLSRAYGFAEAPPDLAAVLADVPTFLARTGLTAMKLDQLIYQNVRRRSGPDYEVRGAILGQFFINQTLVDGKFLEITPLGPGTNSIPLSQRIENLDGPADGDDSALSRLHRFLRLARLLGWSFANLDLALRSVAPPPNTQIDMTTLEQLAAIAQLARTLKLPIDELCAFWSDMSTTGLGNGDTPEDLFDRIFNLPTPFYIPEGKRTAPPYRPQYAPNPLWTDSPIAWDPTDRTSGRARQVSSRLRAVLRLNEEELSGLAVFLQGQGLFHDNHNQKVPTHTITLGVENLSVLFRYSRLAQCLGMAMDPFIQWLYLIDRQTWQTLSEVQEIVVAAQKMQALGLDFYHLQALQNGDPLDGAGYSPVQLNSMLASLEQASQPVRLTPHSFVDERLGPEESTTLFDALVEGGLVDSRGVVNPLSCAVPESPERFTYPLDGATNTIQIPQDPFSNSTSLTLTAWARPTRLETSAVILGGRQRSGAFKPTVRLGVAGALEVLYLDASLTVPDFIVQDGWVHVAWVLDNGTWSIYRNGLEIRSEAVPLGPSPPPPTTETDHTTDDTGYFIGSLGSQAYFEGTIANVGIWHRALDAADIAVVVLAQTLPCPTTSPAHYWPIDDQGLKIADRAGGDNNNDSDSDSGKLEGLLVPWSLEPWPADRLAGALLAQDAFVTQHFASFLGTSPESVVAATTFRFASHEDPAAHINQVLQNEASTNEALVADLAANLRLAAAFELSPAEMRALASQPQNFGLQFSNSFYLTFDNLMTLAEFKRLANTFHDTENRLIAYFQEPTTKKLAQATGWPQDQIETLEGQSFWREGFKTVAQVVALEVCFAQAARLGVNIDFLLHLRELSQLSLSNTDLSNTNPAKAWQGYLSTARDLLQTLAATFGTGQFHQALTVIEGKTEEQLRDVLVDYLLFLLSSEFTDLKTPDDLYDFLLTDVEMSSLVQIPRLKEGLNALQLYVLTTRMNLEAEVTNHIPQKWWAWMSHYRVWQANREIFLYPENYVDPTLRASKSAPFAQLESDLGQGSLTSELVTAALTKYLDGMAQTAQLQIVASYRAQVESASGKSVDTLFLFGRTRTEPTTFYFRSVQIGPDNSLDGITWTPWEKIDLPIHAEEISVVYAFGRLFVFWVELAQKTIQVSAGSLIEPQATRCEISTANLKFSLQKLDDRWTAPQNLTPNLVVGIYPPTVYQDKLTFGSDPSDPDWARPQALHYFKPPSSGTEESPDELEQILITYGSLIPTAAGSITSPSRTGSAELDAFNHMLYVCQKLVYQNHQDAPSHQVSLVPGWLLNASLVSQRANLIVDPGGKNFGLSHGNLDFSLAGPVDFVFYPRYEVPPKDVQLLRLPKSHQSYGMPTANQPGWSTFDTGDEAFLVAPSKTQFRQLNELLHIVPDLESQPPTIAVSFGNAADHLDPSSLELRFHRLSSHSVVAFQQDFLIGGPDRLLTLTAQHTPELPFSRLQPTSQALSPAREEVDFGGAFGDYFWELFFHIPFLIAETFARDQQFEPAQHWYQYIFNPTSTAQVKGRPVGGARSDRFWNFLPFLDHTLESLRGMLTNPKEIEAYEDDPFDPDAIARLRIGAYQKGIVLRYVENLLAWGNQLFAQYSWETVSQATMLYTEALDLLGPAPQEVGVVPPPPPKTVEDFIKEYGAARKIPQFLIDLENHLSTEGSSEASPRLSGQPFNHLDSYFCVPENARLQNLWQEANTQLTKIRHGENIEGQREPLPAFQPPIPPGAAARGGASGGASNQRSGANVPHYRFSYLIERARGFTVEVIAFGAELLSALEKQDAEAMALLLTANEGALLLLATQIKEQRIAELEASGEALAASLQAATERQSSYRKWLAGGISAGEKSSLKAGAAAKYMIVASGASDAISTPLYMLPTIFGLADGGFNPGGSMQAVSSGLSALSSEQSLASQATATVAGYTRRAEEWTLQLDLAGYDVNMIQAQIEAHQATLDSAQVDLDLHQARIAETRRVQAFYQSKFTNQQLYQWMAGQLSTLYYASYQLAFALAREAQAAFQYEKNSTASFLDYGAWNQQKKGLMAGQRLMLGLESLEKTYLDADVRHLEIEKTISLLDLAPQAVLQLKATGRCHFELPELLFDYDHPGHYNRRIKTLSVTLPALVGPYQNVSARLTQNTNRVVTQPDAGAVAYLLSGKGPPPASIRSNWNTRQEIAISRGSDDSGLFELHFEDPRYLPFEGTGAVSSWTLEMPPAANPIDMSTLSDVILRLRYTSQNGGLAFRQAVLKNAALQRFSGLHFLSLRQSFPAAWQAFPAKKKLPFHLEETLFPPNLTAGSRRLGDGKGKVLLQWLVNEGAKAATTPLSLNGTQVGSDHRVPLPGSGGQPIPWADLKESLLISAEEVPTTVTDVVVILPFTGDLNWGAG